MAENCAGQWIFILPSPGASIHPERNAIASAGLVAIGDFRSLPESHQSLKRLIKPSKARRADSPLPRHETPNV